MNKLQERLYHAPSIDLPYCPFCGKPATNRHHIVPRSQGGHDGATVTVCGMGNTSGCHKKLHEHRLHMRYEGQWEYIETEQPTKYETALALEGWRVLPVHELGEWI